MQGCAGPCDSKLNPTSKFGMNVYLMNEKLFGNSIDLQLTTDH